MKSAVYIITGVLLSVSLSSVNAKSEPEYPYPGGKDADIWVLAGQSNMQGAGLITKKYKSNPKIKVFNMDNKWISSVPPSHRIFDSVTNAHKNTMFAMNPALTEADWENAIKATRKNPGGGIGPDTSFAETIVKYTGHNVGLIPCALGATGMVHWNPADLSKGTESLYGNMINRIKLVGGNLKGMLWYQGESETGPGTQDSFEKTFLNIVDSIRRDTGRPDLPFIYVQIARYALENQDNAKNWEIIRDKQRTAAYKRDNLFVVPAIDLPIDDLIHIGTAGQEILGRRMARIALDKVYKSDEGATAIDYDSYELLPALDPLHNKMRIKFKGVNGKLQAAGRPNGFSLRSDDPRKDGPYIFKIEMDPDNPSAVIAWYSKEITEPMSLYYGGGLDPYVNIVDSKEMAVPAFGPITVKPKK